VPWEVQAINTCPDNFLWEKNKSPIILVAPGLYQITFGFYAKKLPVVRVYVNSEMIFCIQSGGKDVGKENSGGLNKNVITSVGKHSAGNISGLTLNEFVALPARARISLCYEGDAIGEGFFSLRKL